MFIGMKATFKRLNDAKKAYKEVENKLDGSKAQLEFESLDYSAKQHSGMLSFYKIAKFAFYGLLIGAVTGYIVYAIIGASLTAQVTAGWTTFSIVTPFAVIGAICGAILYAVRKERTVKLNDKDIEHDKAVISVTCDKNKLTLIEKIMDKYHADNVFVS